MKTVNYIKTISVLVSSTLIVFLFSCKKQPTSPQQQNALPTTVSFNTHIVPIFNASCVSSGCHSGVSAAANLNLTANMAYSQLFAKHEIDTVTPNNSVLYIEVQSGSMPRGAQKLSDYNIQLIQKWIQQKAKNN